MKTKTLLMLLAIASMAGVGQANMLLNPGFEEGTFATRKIPDGWFMSYSSYSSAWSWLDDAYGAHGGSKYLKMVSYTVSASSAWMFQTVEVTAGQEYAFGVWAKSPVEDELKEVRGYYEWTEPNDDPDNELGYRVISEGDLGYWDWVEDDWEQAYFGWQVAPAGATHCMFSLVGTTVNGDDGILFDDAYMTDKFAKLISPKEIVGYSPYEAVLSWTNMDPNTPGDPVYVDVWFGTNPNDPNDPGDPNDYIDFNKVVSAGEDLETWTENDLPVGIYFWRVDSYIRGSATGDPVEGFVWGFKVTDDFAPSVDAGTDMITWSGEDVTLDPNIVDDGRSPLTYHWTADIPDVVFEPNEYVENPTVTITPDSNSIWIVNPGFEHPPLADGDRVTSPSVNGWTEGFYGYISFSWYEEYGEVQGVINPDTKYGYGGEAPEGQNIAEVVSIYERGGLEQILSVNAMANTTYTLSFMVGTPDVQMKGSYAVELMAGTHPLFIIEDRVPARSTWVSVSKTFHVAGTDPSDPNYARIGKPLKIRLLKTYEIVSDLNFDNIRLTSTSEAVSPDPSAVNLTLTVSDDAPHTPYPPRDTVTIDVYENECMAARGAGQQPEPDTDIVTDCITEIKDLAEMVNTWLDDNSIAAQHKAERVIYYDDFSGDGSSTLNATIPDERPGWESWISNEYIMDDGTRPVPPGDPHVSAVIPFAPLTDNVYQLSVTIDADGTDGWMALGFTEEASIRSWVAKEMMAVGYIRQGCPYGNINTYLGPINEEGHSFTYPTSEGPYDVMIELDTNPDPWTLEFFAAPTGEPLVSLRGPEAYPEYRQLPESDPPLPDPCSPATHAITHVGIGFFAENEGIFDDFKLHEGPIPPPPGYLVDAGSSWAASKGESITIDDAAIDQPPLAYAWTVDPNVAADVDITGSTTLDPTVTFTGSTTDNPTIIELELYATYSDSDPNLNASDTTKIYFYDDSCKVAIGAGQELYPADVDQDCDTDLADFAAISEEWLEDYTLTEPAEKP